MKLGIGLHIISNSRFEQVEGVDCVLVAKENNPITGICEVPESSQVWVTTTSPDLNKWSDFPVRNAQIVKPLGAKFNSADYSVEIPSTCIIQQNGSAYLSNGGGGDAFGKAVEGQVGEVPVTPLYSKPLEHKFGGWFYTI
jgi:hypothetical protein